MLLLPCLAGQMPPAIRHDTRRPLLWESTHSSPSRTSTATKNRIWQLVEVQKSSSSRITQYSIRFQLTAGISQVFGVTAPSGGLQIVARDLNGDNALDVLVTTSLQHEQVAVLLNDGHGKFRLADASDFPAAIQENGRRWNSGTILLCDSSALIRIEYPAGELGCESKFDGPQSYFKSARPFDSQGSAKPSLFSLLGRAPPSFLLQS